MPRTKRGNLGNAIDAGLRSGKQRLPSAKRVMPLADIKDRPKGDTRSLNPEHVSELLESIQAIGLVQPLAIDKVGHLIAGAHRRAAIALLQKQNSAKFEQLFPGGIPVRVFDFDASKDVERATVLEIAENEKRRDYTPSEVRELADRLIKAGYQAQAGGRRKGQKALKPAIALIIGKSTRTVQRYLNPPDDKSMEETNVPSIWEKRAQQLIKWEVEIQALPNGDGVAKQAAKLRKMLMGLEM